MRWIYLSPHLDDAIFSMGGVIYEQASSGLTPEVWTVMSKVPKHENVSPFANKIHLEWGFKSTIDAIRSRREENRRACEIAGAKDVYLEFSDCIYRHDQNGNWLYDKSTFTDIHPDDDNIIEQLYTTLNSQINPEDEIVCPLAIGNHVDHVIVNLAAKKLRRFLWYYIDVPYIFEKSSALDEINKKMKGNRKHVSFKGMINWQKSAGAYSSQIPMEFESLNKLRFSIAKCWGKGVKLWHDV